MSWPAFLDFHSTTDGVLRAIAVMLLAVLIIRYSTLFEEEYSRKLTDLYIYPWWRMLIVILLVSSAMWCPRVGILMALLLFFYLSDMNTLLNPITEMSS